MDKNGVTSAEIECPGFYQNHLYDDYL